MTNNQAPPPEQSIARVTVRANADLLPPVVDFVKHTTRWLGLRDAAAKHLDRAVGRRRPLRRSRSAPARQGRRGGRRSGPAFRLRPLSGW